MLTFYKAKLKTFLKQWCYQQQRGILIMHVFKENKAFNILIYSWWLFILWFTSCLSLLCLSFNHVYEVKDFSSSCNNFVAIQLHHTFVIIKYVSFKLAHRATHFYSNFKQALFEPPTLLSSPISPPQPWTFLPQYLPFPLCVMCVWSSLWLSSFAKGLI